jgi:hypothetical protein
VWVNKEHIPTDHFWEVFRPNSLQEQRSQTRNKYSKEYWIDNFKTLQELSLQAYSSSRHRSIDSIELVLKLDTQQDLYHRVVLDDSRGIPIRYSTLEPYSIQELQEFINSAYQDWYKAGGYFYYKFYINYPTFWIDLWTFPSYHRMVFTRSGRGGYPCNPGRGGGIRGQMTPPRRWRSLSPTQFRFLYPATPLGSPGVNATQPHMSLKEVKAHAQENQNEARRRAQNAEMLLQCVESSISKDVYARLHQLQYKYTMTREPEKEEVQDGVCYLKTLIDCYHVNTRSSTGEIRKKLAQLHLYMKHTAKGDMVQELICGLQSTLIGSQMVWT